MEPLSRQPERDGSQDTRHQTTLPLQHILGNLMCRWGKEPEYRLWILQKNWGNVADEPWIQFVSPERVDDQGRLVVNISHAPAVSMEIHNKGNRWKTLLDACRRESGFHFTDLVLGTSTGVQKKPRTPEHRIKSKRKG